MKGYSVPDKLCAVRGDEESECTCNPLHHMYCTVATDKAILVHVSMCPMPACSGTSVDMAETYWIRH